MTKSKFIVVEGIEGAGKTHACNHIKKTLKKYGIRNIISVREPGGTKIAENIRTLITMRNHKEKIFNETELLLMYAARIQLIENIIKPALKKGIWVIGDRHDMSSLAYQGGGCNIDKNFIVNLKKKLLGSFRPNLTIYLDVQPKIGLKRVFHRGRPDRIEQKKISFFKKVRNTYLTLIASDPRSILINANKTIFLVMKTVENKLYQWLKKNHT